jgi:hypothetical protein
MDANRLFRLCSVVLVFGGVLGCSAARPPLQSQPISIPQGMRAVSLRAKVASSVQPGSHVDVLVTGESQSQSTVLLEDIELAASNHGIVTLLTSPKDAEKLANASEKDHIELVLHKHLISEVINWARRDSAGR